MNKGIYAFYSKTQPRVYIGQSINLKQRKCEHYSDLSRGVHHAAFLQRHYTKYGSNDIEYVVLFRCDDVLSESLTAKEQEQFDIHLKLGFKLFNSKSVADKTNEPTAATRELQSLVQTKLWACPEKRKVQSMKRKALLVDPDGHPGAKPVVVYQHGDLNAIYGSAKSASMALRLNYKAVQMHITRSSGAVIGDGYTIRFIT